MALGDGLVEVDNGENAWYPSGEAKSMAARSVDVCECFMSLLDDGF